MQILPIRNIRGYQEKCCDECSDLYPKKYLKFKPKKLQEITQILPKVEKIAAFCKTQLAELKQAILRH
jgi:hypothetical protein